MMMMVRITRMRPDENEDGSGGNEESDNNYHDDEVGKLTGDFEKIPQSR